MIAAALRTYLYGILVNDKFAAVAAVICRYSVSPPKLTGYAPILDVFHPIKIYLAESRRNKFYLFLSYDVYRRLSQRLHFDKPLLADDWLDRRMTAIAFANVVFIVLYLDHKALRLQVFANTLARFNSVESFVCAGVVVHRAVVVHYPYDLQVVSQSHFKVIGVVRRSYLYRAASKVFLDVLVGNDRYLLAYKRESESLAYHVDVSFVLGIDGDRSISKHSLRTGRCNDYFAAAVGKRISNMPKVRILLAVFYFCVAERSLAARTPIYYPVALIYQTFVVKIDKDFAHRLRTLLVHSKGLARPIARRAELFELLDNATAVLFFPCPSSLQKAVSTHVLLSQALFLFHLLDYLYFRRDRSVVGAGEPERAESLHSLKSDNDVLNSIVERVPDMKLSCNIRRRYDDCKRLLLGVGFCLEIPLVYPFLIKFVFKRLWIVCL